MTKVPKNPIGESAVAALRKYNVNCDFVAQGGERLGIYFLETAASMRASNVVYDRAHSSIAEAKISDFDFDAIFEGMWMYVLEMKKMQKQFTRPDPIDKFNNKRY